MAEIIVEAARDLYTDEEWAEIAQERVTRCRDCKHFEQLGLTQGWLSVCMRGTSMMLTNANGYCAWGEPHD